MQNQAIALNIVVMIVCGYLIYQSVVFDIEEPDPVPIPVIEDFNHINQQDYYWIETDE
jgi:hypothetical protein